MKFANVWFDTMAATFLGYYVVSNVVGKGIWKCLKS